MGVTAGFWHFFNLTLKRGCSNLSGQEPLGMPRDAMPILTEALVYLEITWDYQKRIYNRDPGLIGFHRHSQHEYQGSGIPSWSKYGP